MWESGRKIADTRSMCIRVLVRNFLSLFFFYFNFRRIHEINYLYIYNVFLKKETLISKTSFFTLSSSLLLYRSGNFYSWPFAFGALYLNLCPSRDYLKRLRHHRKHRRWHLFRAVGRRRVCIAPLLLRSQFLPVSTRYKPPAPLSE